MISTQTVANIVTVATYLLWLDAASSSTLGSPFKKTTRRMTRHEFECTLLDVLHRNVTSLWQKPGKQDKLNVRHQPDTEYYVCNEWQTMKHLIARSSVKHFCRINRGFLSFLVLFPTKNMSMYWAKFTSERSSVCWTRSMTTIRVFLFYDFKEN